MFECMSVSAKRRMSSSLLTFRLDPSPACLDPNLNTMSLSPNAHSQADVIGTAVGSMLSTEGAGSYDRVW